MPVCLSQVSEDIGMDATPLVGSGGHHEGKVPDCGRIMGDNLSVCGVVRAHVLRNAAGNVVVGTASVGKESDGDQACALGPETSEHGSFAENDSVGIEGHAGDIVNEQDEIIIDTSDVPLEHFCVSFTREEETLMRDAAHAVLYRRLRNPQIRASAVVQDDVLGADSWAPTEDHELYAIHQELEEEDVFIPKHSQTTTE